MSDYEELAKALAQFRSSEGGSEYEKLAAAALAYAALLYECVKLSKALKRADHEVTVFEDTTRFTMRLADTSMYVERFSGKSRIGIEFYGFHSSVVPSDKRIQHNDVAAASRDEILKRVEATVAAVGALWRAEFSLRAQRK